MRPLKHVWLAAFLFAFNCSSVFGQDAQKIVEQYIKAAGGSKAITRIHALALEGALEAGPEESAGTFTYELREPNRCYLEVISGEKRLIEGFNGKSGWRETHAGEPRTLLGSEAIEIEAMALVANTRLRELKKNKLTVTWVGSAEVRGRPAVELQVATAAGGKLEEFFDAQTHLIIKEAAQIGSEQQEIFYSDYRPEQGVQVPHGIELRRGADAYRAAIRQVSVNGAIGDSVFDFPRKSQIHLPDLKALFHEIDENQKAIDKIKENYAGSRIEEETEYDGKGNVKKRQAEEYTFFYLYGHEVSTLVKKNGVPLSAEEQKKENERVEKHIREIQEREAKREAKEQKKPDAGKKENEDEDEVEMETFLRACQFINPRRERFRGQDVLVFDFEGNPEFTPHKLEEKIVQKLAGVVWIDEKDHDVARLEAHFSSDARIAAGLLVNLQRGSGFVFEQEFVNGEVWLPTYAEAYVGVRVLLVKGFNVRAVTRYSDYKRFNVESISKISAPKQP